MTHVKRDPQTQMWPESSTTEATVTTTEAAALAGVNERSVRRWVDNGRIQATATGRIPLAELRRLGYEVSPVEQRDQLLLEIQHLQQLIAVLERELADAKDRERLTQIEKQSLLTLLKAWQPTGASRDEPSSKPRRPPNRPFLWERIYDYVATSPRPRAIYEVQKALGLDKDPSRELSRLFKRQLLIRPKKGKYWVAPGSRVEPGESDAS